MDTTTIGPDAGTGPHRKHLIDRRAGRVAADVADGHPDDLMSTQQLAIYLGVSEVWCEHGRLRGYGPKYIRLSPRRTRYRRQDVLAWLEERVHLSTREYETSNVRGPGRGHGKAGEVGDDAA